MSQERISAAITRIEQALVRLEQRPAAAQPRTDLADLEARHAGLKSATTAAIRQIDGLLGELDRADG
jgi:hypothetical protein